MQAQLKEISQVAEQVASSLGMSVLDVKLGQQGKNRTLEVTVYKAGGSISLSDCEKVSRNLEIMLDEKQPPLIDGAFSLEVQSPGTDRKLSSEREFAVFSGQEVEVKTKQSIAGLGAAFTGKLAGMNAGCVVIESAKKMSDQKPPRKHKNASPSPVFDSIEVDMSNVIHVRLLPQMPTSTKDIETTAL